MLCVFYKRQNLWRTSISLGNCAVADSIAAYKVIGLLWVAKLAYSLASVYFPYHLTEKSWDIDDCSGQHFATVYKVFICEFENGF